MALAIQSEVNYPTPGGNRDVVLRPRPPKQSAAPTSAILALDAQTATHEQHAAAAAFAGTWKGYSVRRKLASDELYAEHCRKHAITIQCFFRRWLARSRLLSLRAAREERLVNVVEMYNQTKLLEIRPAANWQKKQFEQAARLIQAVYRWYLEKRDAVERGDRSSDIPYPLRSRRKSALLPYRRKTLLYRDRCVGRGSADHSLVNTPQAGSPLAPQRPHPSTAPSGARRPSRGSGKDHSLAISSTTSLPIDVPHHPRSASTDNHGIKAMPKAAQGGALTVPGTGASTDLVVYQDHPPHNAWDHSKFPGPPTQQEVEESNAVMRRREQEVRELLASPPQQKRIDHKRQGIESKDFDHCASILQRRFRTVMAKQEVHSRQCRSEYFDRYATRIQCAFRAFMARRQAAHKRRNVHGEAYLRTRRYEMQQVDTLSEEYSWNAHVMNAAAKILQTAFRRHHAKKSWTPGSTPHATVQEYLASDMSPQKLPLGLLKDCPPHKKTPMTVNRETTGAVQRPHVFRRHYSRQGRKRDDLPTAEGSPVASAARRHEPTDEERDRAALRIQCGFRQHLARQHVDRKRVERREAFDRANMTDAARTIQAAHRRKHNHSGDGGAHTPSHSRTPTHSSLEKPLEGHVAVPAPAAQAPPPAVKPGAGLTKPEKADFLMRKQFFTYWKDFSRDSKEQQRAKKEAEEKEREHNEKPLAHQDELVTMTHDEKEELKEMLDASDRPEAGAAVHVVTADDEEL